MRFGSISIKKLVSALISLIAGLMTRWLKVFEGRVIILGKSHELSESVHWNKRRFTLIPGNIEIVKTDFPENQGVSVGKPVLQT